MAKTNEIHQTCILVLGQPYSGALSKARLLDLLGYVLPNDLMESSPGVKEVKKFSRKTLSEIHKHFFKQLGLTWDTPAWLPQGWQQIEAALSCRSEISDFLASEVGWMDRFIAAERHLGRLVPMWLELLSEMEVKPVFVLPVRPFAEIARDLETTQGIEGVWAEYLWLIDALESERATRGAVRTFVPVDEIADSPRRTAELLEKRLALDWPELESVLRTATKAISTEKRDEGASHPKAAPSDWTVRASRAFECLVKDPEDAVALSNLEEIRDEMTRTVTAYGAIVSEILTNRATLVDRIDSLRSEDLVESSRARALETELSRSKQDLEKIKRELGLTDTTFPEFLRVLRERRKDAASVQERLDKLLLSKTWRWSAPMRQTAANLKKSPLQAGWNALRYAKLVKGSGLFDRTWYLAKYPDVAAAGIDPWRHFITHGMGEGRSPGPGFDAKAYLRDNPDVRASSQYPLIHYLRYGRAERRPAPGHGPSYALGPAAVNSETKERVLVIDRRVPGHDQDSASLRVFSILRELVRMGHHVTFLPVDGENPEPYTTQLLDLGVFVAPQRSEARQFVTQHARAYDHIVLSGPETVDELLAFVIVYAPRSSRIFDTGGLHYLHMEGTQTLDDTRGRADMSIRFNAIESSGAQACDLTLTMTEQERQTLHEKLRDVATACLPNIQEANARQLLTTILIEARQQRDRRQEEAPRNE